jgi:hypothetical protein
MPKGCIGLCHCNSALYLKGGIESFLTDANFSVSSVSSQSFREVMS